MHVVLDIVYVLLILTAISFGGLGLHIAYVNHKRRDVHKAREEKQNGDHEAWVVGLWDDAELFFTGSEDTNPKRAIS